MSCIARYLTVRLCSLIMLCSCAATAAEAFEPTPALIDLTVPGSNARATITGTNHSVTAAPIEVVVTAFTIDTDGTKRLSAAPSSDLKVYPARVVVAPGSTQSFRVQWNGGALAAGKAYQISFRQVPVRIETKTSSIDMVRSFYVLALVSPEGAEATLSGGKAVIETDKQGRRVAVLRFTNTGKRVAVLSRSALTLNDKAFSINLSPAQLGAKIGSGIILPGAERRFILPDAVPASVARLSMRVSHEGKVFAFDATQAAQKPVQ